MPFTKFVKTLSLTFGLLHPCVEGVILCALQGLTWAAVASAG